MVPVNFHFAWCWFLGGLISGTVQGLWFHDEHWLGGYGSWRRRLIRLGHIAFFGTGFLNLCFALSVSYAGDWNGLFTWSSVLLMVGAVTMPLTCYVAAFKPALRHAFVVPVLSLMLGTALFVGIILNRGISS